MVRFNALKHGFCSKQVVISSKLIGEDPKEFEQLVADLWEHLKPAGKLEEMLFDSVVICFWRERRALRCELADAMRISEYATRVDGVSTSTTALDELYHKAMLLDNLKLEIERNNDVAENSKLLIRVCFDTEFKRQVGDFEILRPDRENLEVWKQKTVNEIEKVQEQLRRQMADTDASSLFVQQQEALRRERGSLPPPNSLDPILRYLAQNNRQLRWALTELDRLQRQRKGEYVPAPVKVSVEGPQ